MQGTKIPLAACKYEWNLEKTSNSSQSTRPTGRVLWKELLEAVMLLLMFIIHTLLKDKCMCLQDE